MDSLVMLLEDLELVEFSRLVTIRHTMNIDHLHVGFGAEMALLLVDPKLSFDSICNQLLDLFNHHRT